MENHSLHLYIYGITSILMIVQSNNKYNKYIYKQLIELSLKQKTKKKWNKIKVNLFHFQGIFPKNKLYSVYCICLSSNNLKDLKLRS